jgi:hypothetical protein
MASKIYLNPRVVISLEEILRETKEAFTLTKFIRCLTPSSPILFF